ncbi:dihydroorotate dehydrogenase electron transfer subunit [Candidatus Micrarchaeota archaeon]|nr:dihydroorotate dehydrogenase electron transfer subunit [Candidatus Micrarchaeota archaeon]
MNKQNLPDKRYTFNVKKVVKENFKTSTIITDGKLESKPGQFVMVWIPGINQKPYSIGDNEPFSITAVEFGPFSSLLNQMKKGDKLTVTGPLGRGFDYKEVKKPVLVGGGCGIVPLYFLAKKLKNPAVIMGSKTKNEIMCRARFERLGIKPVITTDDGSEGTRGFVTAALENILEKKGADIVYSCGPAPMMRAVAKICDKSGVDYQLSLETHMKCGIGICGSCTLGDKVVCRDGPVFPKNEIKKIKEFWTG